MSDCHFLLNLYENNEVKEGLRDNAQISLREFQRYGFFVLKICTSTNFKGRPKDNSVAKG